MEWSDWSGSLGSLVEGSAVLVSAFSGMIAARRKRMDFVGTFTVAAITAFGGGTLRDVLLERRPLFWVSHQEYPILIFVLAAGFLYLPQLFQPLQPLAQKTFDAIDALGLGLFSIAGCTAALEAEMPIFIASLFGVITGVFGGILRDVMINQIPIVFRQTSLYATCSFVGSWVYLLALPIGIPFADLGGILATVFLRLGAIRYNLTLPLPPHLKPSARDSVDEID
ncbi:MAG: trimeric intracellular cation channel family protein [Thermostichus sp. HHBFW_bins_43]